jgi:hypothetical protein
MTDSPRPIDPRLIEAARAADILPVARRAGAQLKYVRATQWKWGGPCPSCGGDDRFSINTVKRIFNCRGFGGGDTIAMVRHVLGLDFVEGVEFITGEKQITAPTGEFSDKAAKSAESDDERRARDLKSAKRIASEVRPLLGTPGERYLQETRCIDTAAVQDVLARADAIGWHGAVYLNEPAHALHGQRLGCIVGILTDPKSGYPTGAISRTYIGPDLSKVCKAKTLGTPLGVIRLSADDDVLCGLHLAEGIETGLASYQLGLRPVWALGSAGAISAFPVLSGVECLTILAEHDEASAKAVQACGTRWHTAGREVLINRPIGGKDLNDAMRAAP